MADTFKVTRCHHFDVGGRFDVVPDHAIKPKT